MGEREVTFMMWRSTCVFRRLCVGLLPPSTDECEGGLMRLLFTQLKYIRTHTYLLDM